MTLDIIALALLAVGTFAFGWFCACVWCWKQQLHDEQDRQRLGCKNREPAVTLRGDEEPIWEKGKITAVKTQNK